MTREITEGFETKDLACWPGASSFSIRTAKPRPGSGVAYATPSGANTTALFPFNAVSEFFDKVAFKLDEADATGNYYGRNNYIQWRSATTVQCRITWSNLTGKLYLCVGTTGVVSSINVVDTNKYYLLEVHIKIADSNGLLEWKIDGVPQPSFSGDTKPGTPTTVDTFSIYSEDSSHHICIDDYAHNTISGLVDNSWCGDSYIKLTVVNGNGDVTQLTGSDNDQINNYQLLTDVPSDNDTSYVEGTIIDSYDLYKVAPCGLSNVDIKRIAIEGRSRDTVAVDGKIKYGLKTNNQEDWTSQDISLLTSYSKCKSSEYLLNPVTGQPWTVSELDNLQIGDKVRS